MSSFLVGLFDSARTISQVLPELTSAEVDWRITNPSVKLEFWEELRGMLAWHYQHLPEPNPQSIT